jgi:5-methylcytosine-specific restriction endonuclease McrA
MNQNLLKHVPVRLDDREYDELREQVLRRDNWRCQFCRSMTSLEVHHQEFRSHFGRTAKRTLLPSATTAMGRCTWYSLDDSRNFARQLNSVPAGHDFV